MLMCNQDIAKLVSDGKDKNILRIMKVGLTNWKLTV